MDTHSDSLLEDRLGAHNDNQSITVAQFEDFADVCWAGTLISVNWNEKRGLRAKLRSNRRNEKEFFSEEFAEWLHGTVIWLAIVRL